jgi:hypothetical protein
MRKLGKLGKLEEKEIHSLLAGREQVSDRLGDPE